MFTRDSLFYRLMAGLGMALFVTILIGLVVWGIRTMTDEYTVKYHC